MAGPGGSVNVAVVGVSIASDEPCAATRPRRRAQSRAAPARRKAAGRRKNLRLHHRARRAADPVRTGGVLDRRRHRRDLGRLVGHHRHLFRLQRRRAEGLDRAPGRAAIRLRRPHRRTARPDRPHHEPPIARSGAVRAEAQRFVAPPGSAGIARHGLERHFRSVDDRLVKPAAHRHANDAKTLADQRFTADAAPARPRHLAGA